MNGIVFVGGALAWWLGGVVRPVIEILAPLFWRLTAAWVVEAARSWGDWFIRIVTAALAA